MMKVRKINITTGQQARNVTNIKLSRNPAIAKAQKKIDNIYKKQLFSVNSDARTKYIGSVRYIESLPSLNSYFFSQALLFVMGNESIFLEEEDLYAALEPGNRRYPKSEMEFLRDKMKKAITEGGGDNEIKAEFIRYCRLIYFEVIKKNT